MLRFVKDEPEDGGPARWRPAAGTFAGWPENAKSITMLDPCCGSGHFLTETLAIMSALRQQEEKFSSANSVAAVLRDNLHGLEIDGRCVQIAAFAVALSAWRIGGWQTLPLPHIAWVGAPPPLPKGEFVALANGDANLQLALAALHDLFAQAPLLGSFIEPTGGDLVDPRRVARIEAMLEELIEKTRSSEPERAEGVIAARGMADAARILSRRYTLQATNVPYLGRGKQHQELATFISGVYSEARADLATAMLLRMLGLANPNGTIASVTPQNWLFLGSYKGLRRILLNQTTLNFIGALGPRAFETITGEVVNTALISLSFATPDIYSTYTGIDANDASDPSSKSSALIAENCCTLGQVDQLNDPESRISVQPKSHSGKPLREFASVLVGATTGDAPRYIFKFWEWREKKNKWEFFQTTVVDTRSFGGMTNSILWEQEAGALYRFAESVRHLNHIAQNWRRGKPNWGRRGISVSMMGRLEGSIYTGERYDSNCCAIVPHSEADLDALWALCSSEKFFETIRSNNRSLKIEVGTILSSMIDMDHWRETAAEHFPLGLPDPLSEDPTQWIFHGHPVGAGNGTALHAALARLCGYSWPAETDKEMRLSKEARQWVTQAAKLPPSDDDGLLGLPSVGGKTTLADRLRAYLAEAFGSEWSDALERRLVAEADEVLDKKSGKDGSLEAWLRDRAFRQHCVLFRQRPFLWHIWDGLKDGFSIFVHYHRFDQAALRKLTYTILGDWLARAKAEKNDLRYEKGRELQQKLEKILEGENPYDIFVRWKSLAEHPIGWDPDLDDGVRMNIRPFVKAGVLRETPKIRWSKDRGTDVPSAPWYPDLQGRAH